MNFLIALIMLAAYFICVRITDSTITKFGASKSVSAFRIKYIKKTISISLALFFFVFLISFLGFEYSQISIFLSSVFAILGVALFAQWSILSNVTASLIIFFGFPYRVGDTIRVLDKDGDIIGVIDEIALFHVLIKKGEELITYPNALILQKAVVINPQPIHDSPQQSNSLDAE